MFKNLFFLLLFITMVFSASAAWAVGLGFYGTGGMARDSLSSKNSESSVMVNDSFYGGGFILETVSAKDQLFGYRLKLEYNQFNSKEPDSGLEFNGFHNVGMYHTFGFGVIRTNLVRFWAGPQIGLSYTFGEITKHYSNFSFTSFEIGAYKVKMQSVGVDVLIALGVNFNIGSTATLFIDFGAGYMGKYDTTSSEVGHAIGFKASAGIMFRVADTYQGTAPAPAPVQGQPKA